MSYLNEKKKESITVGGFVIGRYLSGVCRNALRLSSLAKRYVLELYERKKSGLPG